MAVEIKLLAEHTAIFGPADQSVQDLLKGVGTKRLINASTFLLSFNANTSKYSDPKAFLEMFFCKENRGFAMTIWDGIERMRGSQPGANVEIVNPEASLRFFEIVFDYLATDTEGKSSVEAEQAIFKAYVLLNEELHNRSKKTENEEGISLEQLMLKISFPNSDLINLNFKRMLACQIVRSIYLFEFLQQNNDTKYLLTEFLNDFGCLDWKEYLKKLLPIPLAILSAERESFTEVHLNDEKDKESINFFEKLIVKDGKLISDFDFRSIRQDPLLKIAEGIYRVIFAPFVFEKVYKGLYFKLREVNSRLKDNRVKDLKGTLGDYFSERYVLYETLNRTFRKKYLKLTGEQIKAYGVSGEPDYYIRNGNTIFLFESKDTLITAETKASGLYWKYEEEVKKKLYFEENEKGKIKNKAIKQITNNVKAILNGSFIADNGIKPAVVYIYPMLVLHDHQYNCVGFNKLLNGWFKVELESLKAEGLNVERVQDLVVVDIDTLIFLQDFLHEKDNRLDKLIDGYINVTIVDKSKKYRSMEHFEKAIKGSLVPFSFFLIDEFEKRGISRMPKIIGEKGITIFE